MLKLAFALVSLTAHAGHDAGTRQALYFPENPPPGLARAENAAVNWAQPPLGCVEEMVPHRVDRPCLDLSHVANPTSDWPAGLSAEAKEYWYGQRRGLSACRADEVLRREKAAPGSMNPGWIENAWMVIDALRNREAKVNAIYEANRRYGVPLHVLTGAVYQESLFSELGISDDGGNYSCGVEQINLIGWCEWANEQSAAEKAAIGWPAAAVDCDDQDLVRLSFLKPLYQIALTRLKGLPEYRLNKDHFADIPLSRVQGSWPAATPAVQGLRYQLIESYVNHCSEAGRGILAKAHELAGNYRQFVSPALQAKDRYAPGEGFARACRQPAAGNAYPLQTGWLLAVAVYNAGPRAVDAVAYYNQWDRAAMNDPRQVREFTPVDMVSSLYWAGRYNSANDLIEFTGLNGAAKSWIWFKGCVVQRHVARVMQHVTLRPDFFVDSLENGIPCARSTFDGNGKLLQSAVPLFRQRSTGLK